MDGNDTDVDDDVDYSGMDYLIDVAIVLLSEFNEFSALNLF